MIPDHIIIHHSLTKDNQTVSWNAIRKYHVETNGWRDIGYHYGIELIGEHYETLVGRMQNEIGAHCKEDSMNNRSLAICVLGNFDLVEVPAVQFALLIRLVRSLQECFRIPKEFVKRHTDYAPYKSCPGSKFQWSRFINSIK